MELNCAVILKIKDILQGKYIQSEELSRPSFIEIKDKKISQVNILGVIINKSHNQITLEDGTGNIDIRFFGENDQSSDYEISDTVMVIGRPRQFNNKIYLSPRFVKKVNDNKWLKLRKLQLEYFTKWLNSLEDSEKKEREIQGEDILNSGINNNYSEHEKLNLNQKENSQEQTEELDFSYEEESEDNTNEETNNNYNDEENISNVAKEAIKETNSKKELLNFIRDIDPGDGTDYQKVIEKFGANIDELLNKLLEEGDIFEVKAGKYKVLD